MMADAMHNLTDFQIKTISAGGEKRVLNARKDPPDIRDRIYEPALLSLKPGIDMRGRVPKILDQGTEGACTGFALAAVINLLNVEKDNAAFRASARMLYEMARMHDEWPGEDYDGSSCRGAIRGWKNIGVCSETLWPFETDNPGEITIARATDARSNALGAYYRLRAELNDYHQFCAGNPVLSGRGGIVRRHQPPLFPYLLLNWLSIQWFTKLST
ncbi:C1 family peptidase [Oceanimonas marisflavi]|uniref:hypothetical protein n=1 Tax=Oceanimonas marisflavi TaxID=2059724 RepID=UPI000D2FB928|nr:hypothetical protein [Oceanimonas marisflavi]